MTRRTGPILALLLFLAGMLAGSFHLASEQHDLAAGRSGAVNVRRAAGDRSHHPHAAGDHESAFEANEEVDAAPADAPEHDLSPPDHAPAWVGVLPTPSVLRPRERVRGPERPRAPPVPRG